MSTLRSGAEFLEDFFGGITLGTSASQGSRFVVADTSAAGTPTYGKKAGEHAVNLKFSSNAEVQNLCLHFGDQLDFDIDLLHKIEIRGRIIAAAGGVLDSASTLVIGLGSARNNDPDAVTAHTWFKLVGGSNSLLIETDDGVNDNDDHSAGVSVTDDTNFVLQINFNTGTSDVRFYADVGSGMQRVGHDKTFDLSNYSDSLQPIVQLQKTADANTDEVVIDYVHVEIER